MGEDSDVMKRWEYQLVLLSLSDDNAVEAKARLNELGRDGR
jgi:hypothetical protein